MTTRSGYPERSTVRRFTGEPIPPSYPSGVPMPIPVRFVLVHPRTPENQGAAARALKNFGQAEWTWVRPPWAPDDPRARTLAVGAEDVLASAPLAPTPGG